ncbi:MAG: protein translocase subunit SecD [Jatrophihabitans sp.]|uniref:protein translocase subunit SecD n=1 Tax=Jatrophihabitans sp. TaxID=1932789 RepID=UPI003F801D7C
MAAAPGQLRVGRYFLALAAIIALLYTLALWPGDRHTPRLGIDLVGGTQATFQARTLSGSQTPTASAMDEAKAIMEDRVNGSGVTQATVVVQGTNEIVVSIPGGTSTDIAKLGQPAVLNFRGLVAPAAATTCRPAGSATPSPSGSAGPSTTGSPSAPSSSGAPSPSASTSPSSSVTPKDASHHRLAPTGASSTAPRASATPLKVPSGSSTAPSPSTSGSGSASGSPSAPAPSASSAAPVAKCTSNPLAPAFKADPKLEAALSSPNVYTANGLTTAQVQQITAYLGNFDCDSAQDEPDLPNHFYIACDYGKQYGTNLVYLLGPVIVKGSEIDSADAQAPNPSNGGSPTWSVSLNLKSSGDKKWGDYTGAHNIGGATSTSSGQVYSCSTSTTPCPDFVAFTLNGRVISSPVNTTTISGVATQITGNFSQSEANDLANQLKYGALPLSFKLERGGPVSATLGTSQLHSALLAGGIGLILVVLYSLIYYRGLGFVTIASLIVSAGLTYASLVFLGRQIGFTLDLAGIAGFIVALGITADSFVVFFERLKDEVHEGRSIRVAVPRAWVRARRTILSADAVSFLAAAVLYYFASADVKGFAFTLGMSTILDLVVVFLFTHPLLSLLSRSRAFGSPTFTGLNSLREGVVPATASAARPASRAAEATPAAEPAAPSAFAGTITLEKTATDEAGGDDEPERPRRRTTPEAGTAAERAAARRARQREKGDR